MANVTVTIHTDRTEYNPNQLVSQGDTVFFQLDNGGQEVDVYFDQPSYLVGAPAPLTVGLQGASVTVSENAPMGAIHFTVQPTTQGSQAAVIKQQGEAVTGELDVTTEPPAPPKE